MLSIEWMGLEMGAHDTIHENHFNEFKESPPKSSDCMNNTCTDLFECRFHVLQSHALGICPGNLTMQHFIMVLPLGE